MRTKITCPHCGTEFAIPEQSHFTIGVVIGKDSNLGEIHPSVAKEQAKAEPKKPTANERLEALRKAGIDTTGMFAINGASSEGMLVRVKDGNPVKVEDNDPIYDKIKKSGTIPERSLFRRWVMSQMFHMLAHEQGFTEALKERGYDYQWKMTLEELRVQCKLHKNDFENFTERSRWFTKVDIELMIADYLDKLTSHIASQRIRKCKGSPYIRINGRNIYLSDIQKVLIDPARKACVAVCNSKTPEGLYKAFAEFYVTRVKLPFNTQFSSRWVSAYKGSGAYFTLKNLILFHGCRLREGSVLLGQNTSLVKLDSAATKFSNGDGYKLFAMLKAALEYNHIDIKKKMAEWAK